MGTTPETKLFPEIKALLQEKVSARNLQSVEEMVGRFSYEGQIVIATFLVYADEDGKTTEAIALLEKFYEEHWKFQHPDIRGNPDFSVANAQYLERAYQELGIVPPQERK